MLPLVILFLGGIALTIGDILMKRWLIGSSIGDYSLGMLLYVIGLNMLVYTFKFKNIAIASTVFVIFNVVTLAIAG